jgi:hypothetical protein
LREGELSKPSDKVVGGKSTMGLATYSGPGTPPNTDWHHYQTHLETIIGGQSLGYRTPRQIYQEGLWICGRSALPTGCASPASRSSSVGGEMLAFAHIPTGAAANKEFHIDEVNSRSEQ